MKFRKWLIKKLGGYTENQVRNIRKNSIIQEIEMRMTGGKEILVVGRNIKMFDYFCNMLNKELVKIDKTKLTVKYYENTFRFISMAQYEAQSKIKGMTFNGYFIID